MLTTWMLSSARAATLMVNTPLDVVNPADAFLSLREALAAAAPGDTVTFSTAFPTGSVTAIAVTGGTLSMATDGVTLDGDGRVRLDGSAAPANSTGLDIAADTVVVVGLEIVDFPGHGIHVTAASNVDIGSTTAGRGNTLQGNGLAGIRLGSANTLVRDIDVIDNHLEGNCVAPSGVCGNLEVLGSGQITDIGVEANVSLGALGNASQAQGTGILVGFGTNVRVIGNIVADNAGTGILAASNSAAIVITGLQVTDNVLHGNEKHGILLGPGSFGAQLSENRVGAGFGNDGHGVMVFGSDGHLIVGNAITGNATGIAMGGASGGDWQSDQLVSGNLIGVDATGVAAPNRESGISSAGGEGGSAIVGNVVSGNLGSGIELFDGGHTVTGNLVGTTPDGLVAVPNGGGSLPAWPAVVLRGAGITFGGSGTWTPLPEPAVRNVVSGNAGIGILVGPGAEQIEVGGNLVGLASDGETPLGNDGAGIVVDGADATLIGGAGRANLVATNEGIGIVVSSANGVTLGTTIERNVVGLTLSGQAAGNKSDGIRVAAGGAGITGVTMADNVVSRNLGVGVRVTTGASVDLRRNRITDNQACALKVTGGPGSLVTPPVVASASSRTIHGTFTLPAGMTAERVEVFWDDDDEMQEYLGEATITGSSWELHELADRAVFPVGGRPVATLTVGPYHATSGIPAGCGDGCTTSGGSCDDGNPCTADTCTSGTCSHTPAAGSCVDGNACTTADTCVAGRCTEGTLDPMCPASLACTELDTTTGVMVDRTCDDADECSTRNTCSTQTGECVPNNHDQKCDDGLGCTSDECLSDHGCVHPLMPAGFLCEEGDACTGLGTCDPAGTCVGPSTPEECPLEHTWSTGTCNPSQGCSYAGIDDGYCGPDELCDDPFGDCLAALTNPSGAWGSVDLDSDQDGLPDEWERAGGADLDGDGDSDVDLPGANVDVPDIFVEIDYMVAGDHDERPKDIVIERDIGTFLRVEADVGKREAYNLHLIVDDPLPHHEILDIDDSEVPTSADCADWISLSEYKRDWFDPRNRGFYHYAVFGHRSCHGASGTGEIWGDDLVLQVTSWDPNTQAWVIGDGGLVHELGHNLGLKHGTGGGGNKKPNYQSTMNYRYGGGMLKYDPGGLVDTGLAFTYSPSAAEPLDENALVEADGVTYLADAPGYWVEYSCNYGSSRVRYWEPNAPIDWDCDDVVDTGTVAVDLNQNGDRSQISGHDDWADLKVKIACEQGRGDFQDLSPREVEEEWSDADMAEEGALRPLLPRSDLNRACALNPVAQDGSGQVQLWLRGSDRLDVTALTALTFARAVPSAVRLVDADADGELDAVFAFATSDLRVTSPRDWSWFEGELDTGQRLFGTVPFTWVLDFEDSDGDGVEDRYGCDACPTVAAPPASPDGCL